MSSSDQADFAGIQALGSRAAGYAVAQKCLEVQAAAEERDPSLKTEKRVILHDDARSWFVGALGEMEVGRMLSALGAEWFVRHAVPIGAGTKDVDHLVIGPAGVFVINTKHHRGASVWVGDRVLRINNANTWYLKNGRSDGIDVAKRLGAKAEIAVTVRSVLAMLNASSITDRRATDNRPVAVVDARHLVGWLLSQPRRLSDTELALIRLAAEEPTTWHVDPRAADTYRVMQRFERLVAQTGAQTGEVQRPVERKVVAAPRTRAPRPTAPRTRVPRPTRPPSSKKRPTISALLQMWLPIVAGIVGFLVFRQVANQPCTSSFCFAPYLYVGLKPLALLLILVGLGVGTIATLIWAVRRAVRR